MKIQQKHWFGSVRSLVAAVAAVFALSVFSPARAGNLPWEIWALSGYPSIQALTNSGTLNNTPDVVWIITNSFDTFNVGTTDDHADNYSSRVRGFLQVPETGTYELFLSSAEESQLSLSTDSNPANLAVIAQETNSGAPLFSGPRLAQRTSPPLNLVKGQSYYLEVLHTAADSGSDWIRVGWQTPEGVQQIIPALYVLPWSPNATTPVISDQPQGINLVEGNPLTLTATVQALQPATLQWFKNGQILAGQNVQSIVYPSADPTNAGVYYLQVTDANNNTVISSNATVTVQLDTTPPTLASTELNSKSNLLTVVFSKILNSASATNLSNYSLNNDVTLSNATLAPDGLTVTFNTSNLTPGQTGFVLFVSGVTDRFGNIISPVNAPVDLVWTETFSGGPGYFTAANNNHANGNNFDYSFSINAGGSVGELGGTFVRTTTASAAYLADPSLGGSISLANNVVIRGQIYIHNIAANGNFFFGFTSTNGFGSSFGIQLAEPNSAFAPNFRGQAIAGGTSSAKYPITPELTEQFNLSWNAASGVLTATVGSQTFYSTNISAASQTYNNFVIAALGANSIIQADSVLLYFDNLTYSVGSVRAAPVAAGPTLGVTVQQPVNGEVFPLGSSISLVAQALTAGQPVAEVQFYEQPQAGGNPVKIAETTNSAPTNTGFTAIWNGVAQGSYSLTTRAITTDSLIATSAPVSIYVVVPQGLTPVTEPFAGGLGRFQTQVNSQSLGNSFGFSNTGNAGGAAAGEAGGLFIRSTTPAYLADTNSGTLYPQVSDLNFSGQLYLQNNNWNGTAFIGYVNHANFSAQFGIDINEPNTTSGTAFRGSVVFGSDSSGSINLPPGTPINYSLHWSSSNQTVTGTLAGQPVSFAHVPLTEVFDQVTIGTLGNGTVDNTAQLTLFADDLNYTTVLPAPRLSINGSGGQIQLSWPATGFKLQHSSSLGVGASWIDDNATVNYSGGISSANETPGNNTIFWRLVSQ
jgi:PA14 domain